MCFSKVFLLLSIYYIQLCDISMCKSCHVVHAQQLSHSHTSLLCCLWPLLSTWFHLSLPTSWWLDLVDLSRPSTACACGGSHSNPSCLSQAMSKVDITHMNCSYNNTGPSTSHHQCSIPTSTQSLHLGMLHAPVFPTLDPLPCHFSLEPGGVLLFSYIKRNGKMEGDTTKTCY